MIKFSTALLFINVVASVILIIIGINGSSLGLSGPSQSQDYFGGTAWKVVFMGLLSIFLSCVAVCFLIGSVINSRVRNKKKLSGADNLEEIRQQKEEEKHKSNMVLMEIIKFLAIALLICIVIVGVGTIIHFTPHYVLVDSMEMGLLGFGVIGIVVGVLLFEIVVLGLLFEIVVLGLLLKIIALKSVLKFIIGRMMIRFAASLLLLVFIVIVNSSDKAEIVQLIAAADRGNTESVRLLLEAGADVNAEDKYGSTPLIAAARVGNAELISLLLEVGADVNAKGNRGNTPLIAAADRGNTESVRLLLDAGADVDAKDKYGIPRLLRRHHIGAMLNQYCYCLRLELMLMLWMHTGTPP